MSDRNARKVPQLQISERRLLLRLGDAICIFLAILIALRIWAFVGERDYNLAFILLNSWWFVLLEVLWFTLASANDYYDLKIASDWVRSATTLFQIVIQITIIYVIIFFLSPRDALPRLFILYYAITSIILIGVWRTWRPFLIGWSYQPRRALVVGSGWAARAILEVLETEAKNDYEVVGVVSHPSTHAEVDQTVTLLRDGKLLPTTAESLNASEIILAYGSEMPGDMFQGIMDAYEQGFTITPMPILYEQITGRVPIEHVSESSWLIVLPVASSSVFNPYPFLKRLMDVLLALVGSFFFGLMLPFISLAMWYDSPGPVFFRQERVGKAGKTFKILKLRTMIPDAEKMTGPQWASGDDPRITRVGKFLRKSRLDEMPQLINVLRGEMSLVGPRPERPYFVEKLSQSIPFYRTRNLIKPGVTGWAQVRYSYGNSVEDSLTKLQYDLYYIRHQSLVLDILILLRTIGKMLKLAGV